MLIEKTLKEKLQPLAQAGSVADVRILGAIGVVEMKEPVKIKQIQQPFVDEGIWLRPFGKLVYAMPPFIISEKELHTICSGIANVIK